jgi:hypothetical protein
MVEAALTVVPRPAEIAQPGGNAALIQVAVAVVRFGLTVPDEMGGSKCHTETNAVTTKLSWFYHQLLYHYFRQRCKQL